MYSPYRNDTVLALHWTDENKLRERVRDLANKKDSKEISIWWCDLASPFFHTLQGSILLGHIIKDTPLITQLRLGRGVLTKEYINSSAFRTLMSIILSSESNLKHFYALGLNDHGINIVSEYVIHNSCLERVHLASDKGMYVTEEGAESIVRIMLRTKQLKEFSFQQLYISNNAAKIISTGLSKCVAKRVCLLGKFRDEGLCYIIEAMTTNEHAEELWIDEDHKNSGRAYLKLTELLKKNNRLRRIAYNTITVLEPTRLCKIPAHMINSWTNIAKNINCSLERFDIASEYAQQESVKALKKELADNAKLKKTMRHVRNDRNLINESTWPNVLAAVSNKPDYVFEILKNDPNICRDGNDKKRKREAT